MALYEYECPKCGNKEEIIKSFNDFDKPELCEKCKTEMKRLISSEGLLRFKGNGYYQTDYVKGKPYKSF